MTKQLGSKNRKSCYEVGKKYKVWVNFKEESLELLGFIECPGGGLDICSKCFGELRFTHYKDERKEKVLCGFNVRGEPLYKPINE